MNPNINVFKFANGESKQSASIAVGLSFENSKAVAAPIDRPHTAILTNFKYTLVNPQFLSSSSSLYLLM